MSTFGVRMHLWPRWLAACVAVALRVLQCAALPPVRLSIIDGDSRYGQVITEATLGQAVSLAAVMMDTRNSDFYLYNCTISYLSPGLAQSYRPTASNSIRIIDFDGCAEYLPGLVEKPVYYDTAGVGLAKHALLRLRASAGRTVLDSGDSVIGDGSTNNDGRVTGVTTVYACLARRCSPVCNNPFCTVEQWPVDVSAPRSRRQVPPLPPKRTGSDYADQYIQTVLHVRPQPYTGVQKSDAQEFSSDSDRTCLPTTIIIILAICLILAALLLVVTCCTAAIYFYQNGCMNRRGAAKRRRVLSAVGYYTPSAAPTRASHRSDNGGYSILLRRWFWAIRWWANVALTFLATLLRYWQPRVFLFFQCPIVLCVYIWPWKGLEVLRI